MPDGPDHWQGWRPNGPSGGWTDLSHPLTEDFPNPSYFKRPSIERLLCMPADRLNLTYMSMMCHFGTHIDAPNHFIADGPSIEQVPLDRLEGPGVCWFVEAEPDGFIGRDQLAACRPAVHPGDIVLLDTGWSTLVGSDAYVAHPYLTPDAAEWLVERGVKIVSFDFATPDLPVRLRTPDYDFPIHRTLLGAGTLIVENMRADARLRGRRVQVRALPLPIVGADGSPIRLVARPDDGDA